MTPAGSRTVNGTLVDELHSTDTSTIMGLKSSPESSNELPPNSLVVLVFPSLSGACSSTEWRLATNDTLHEVSKRTPTSSPWDQRELYRLRTRRALARIRRRGAS